MFRTVIALTFVCWVFSISLADEKPKYSVTVTTSRFIPKDTAVSFVASGSPAPGKRGYKPVVSLKEFGQSVDLPQAGPFDIYLLPKNGLAVRIREKWSSEGKNSELKLAEFVGVVYVRSDDLPRASRVILTTQQDPGPEEKGHTAIQEVSDYKLDMLVVPGFYAVWIKPANGARAQKIADKIRVLPGRTTQVPEE